MNAHGLALLKSKLPVSKDVERLNTDNPGLVQREPKKEYGRSATKGDARDPGKAAELERHLVDREVGDSQVQAGVGRRILVRVTAFRERLLDEDNMCEKFHVDLCRYAGIIPGDAPGQTKIEVRQEKVGKGEREFVRIEIF